MYFNKKVEQINEKLSALPKCGVAVWGIGVHTVELLQHTKLIDCIVDFYIDKRADATNGRRFFGHQVLTPDEINFNELKSIIVSSYKFQEDIVKEIKKHDFSGEIITLYSKDDEGEFFNLPKEGCLSFCFEGDYRTWEEACAVADGYDKESILDKVFEATKKVMGGEAVYERDSVLFYDKQYNFRIISLFGQIAKERGRVNLLDFGGALGSEYWKNREFLEKFGVEYSWNIVEQENYVQLGKKYVGNDRLFFYENIGDIDKEIDIVLLSSVLQYLSDYQSVLGMLESLNAKYILVERQPVLDESRICIQHVGSDIYEASYPLRILGEKELLSRFDEEYNLLTVFGSEVDEGRFFVDGKEFFYKGYLFEKV